MKQVTTAVNNELWVPSKHLQNGIVHEIHDALTIDNWDYLKAVELELADADEIEPYVELFRYEGEWLVLPRGFAAQLAEGFEEHGIEVSWRDERNHKASFRLAPRIPLYVYQEKIVEAVLEAEQGIIKAPPGSGKTVAMLAIIRRLPGKAIVLVNTKEIATQWMNRVRTWLGDSYPVSMIGDNQFEVSSHLTIALQPTLWSRFEKLKRENFFRKFRIAFLDECHHATAETYNSVLNEFDAQIRAGASATPEKTGNFELAEAVLGPIIVEITDDDVAKETVKPSVKVIPTEFGDKHGRRKGDNAYMRRKRYQMAIADLATDRARNKLIAAEIINNHLSNANLVLSKRLEHLSNIWDALVEGGYDSKNIYTIVGQDSNDQRHAAIDRIEQADCVVLSTLADEALDAPRLDRLHICWPTRNSGLLEQQIGRIRRRHPEKTEAVVIDYRDYKVDAFDDQYMARRHEVYGPKGFKVEKVGNKSFRRPRRRRRAR